MKKIIVIVLAFIAFGSTSCTKKYKTEISRLNAVNDSLVELEKAKDSFTMDYVRAFNAIQDNLNTIKEKEKLITKVSEEGNTESKQNKEDQINSDIDAIYNLLIENRETVKQLQSKLRASGNKSAELEKMIATLNLQIQAKDSEITELKVSLAKKDLHIVSLEENLTQLEENLSKTELIVDQQSQTIVEKVDELNAIYYIIGTKKSLTEQNIITKEGGFIGIGRTKKISESFDKSLFTKADMRTITGFPVFSKNAQLLSVHPAGSYEFIEGEKKVIDSLKILHSDDFWSASKYMVLMID